ncbi:hypothetical protein LMH73_008215 [Vibrio splendidus]|nr:hypothetical protein [Vibrio splendidus]MCC4880523.1 hypothetical protein [Vibrio splendidus]
MLNNQYYIVDLNGNETFVENLESYIKAVGIRAFNNSFGNEFVRMGWERYYELPDTCRGIMNYTDSNGNFCNCNNILMSKAGKVIPKSQAVSEYLNKYPNEIESLMRFWVARDYGTVRYGNKRKNPRGKRHAKYANLLRKEKYVEVDFNGSISRIRTIRPEDESVIRDMRCWFDELPVRHDERNWKNYRKQQYKIK